MRDRIRATLGDVPDARLPLPVHAAVMDAALPPTVPPREALARLVADGTLSPEQAEAVAAAVLPSPAPDPAPESRPARASESRGIPVAAEALAYLGAAVAGAAALALGAQVWDLLEAAAQVALLVVAAVALWGAGRWVHDPEAPPAVLRLVGFCWLLACGAAAAATAVATDAIGLPGEGTLLVTGLVLTAVAGALWYQRPGALTLLPLTVGAHTVTQALLLQVPAPPEELTGLLIWGVGVAGMTLAWGGILHPPRAAWVLGALGALVGAQSLTFTTDMEAAGQALGLVTSVALIGGGVRIRQGALVGLGAAGCVVFLPQVLFRAFPDTAAAPAALFVAGLALLGLALAAVGRRGRA